MLDELPRLRDLGVTSIEDYVGWNVVEPREREVDFTLHLRHRELVERAGLRYTLYPWVHALPHWLAQAPEFTRFRCVEHRVEIDSPSIFSRFTIDLFDRFYSLVAQHLGPPHQLTIALPCDYGEFGYPAGFGAWVMQPQESLIHTHPGFWCDDHDAVASYRQHLLDRYGSLPAINRAYGLDLLSERAIAPPRDPSAATLSETHRREFLDWYKEALLTFTDRAASIARQHFPASLLAIKCGYGAEAATFGMDYTKLGELAARHEMHLWSTHGTFPVVHNKRLQTICRILDVPYITEGPTEHSREELLDRLFEDASDGAHGFFEFHQTLAEFEADYARYLPLLQGDAPHVDVALLFNSTAQEQFPMQSFPPRLFAVGEPLRDLVDYEVIDERLVSRTGAIDRYRVIAIPDPGPLRTRTIDTLLRFMERGGLLVVPGDTPITERDGGPIDTFTPLPSPTASRGSDTPHLAELAPSFALDFAVHEERWLFGEYYGYERASPYFGGEEEGRCRWTSGDVGFRVPASRDPAPAILELFAPEGAQPERWVVEIDGVVSDLSIGAGAQRLRIPLDAVTFDDDDAAGQAGAPTDRDPLAPVHTVRLYGPSIRPGSTAQGEDRRQLGLLLKRFQRGDGSKPISTRTLERDSAPTIGVRVSGRYLRRRTRDVGAGGILFAPPHDLSSFANLVAVAATHPRPWFDDDAPPIEIRRNGVRETRLDTRILLYNRTDRRQTHEIDLSAERRRVAITLAPLEIRELLRGNPPA